MRQALVLFVLLVSLPALASEATGRVIKVLPLFLDTNGVAAISPSLFDRDAYQLRLREHPRLVSGMRIDVLWKTHNAANEKLTLRAELRGVGGRNLPTETTLETNLLLKTSRHWTSLKITGPDYKNFGMLMAWRVTLWDGDKMLGEQKSYLW
ncbi:MAG TPA: hypothetical protein VMH30_00715 [Verrucomicrobiae bacterium]|jgi:hypothetical protein|nr:hypothetical protein [Verrucomicrobiae bacterium]